MTGIYSALKSEKLTVRYVFDYGIYPLSRHHPHGYFLGIPTPLIMVLRIATVRPAIHHAITVHSGPLATFSPHAGTPWKP